MVLSKSTELLTVNYTIISIHNLDVGPYSPVPRHSFAHIFDTKLREMSFEKQNSAK